MSRGCPPYECSGASSASQCTPLPSTLSLTRPRPSDAYHTCYVLSGLSSAQHTWTLSPESEVQLPGAPAMWDVEPCVEGDQVFDEGDRVGPSHPVYAIPQEKVEAITVYFGEKPGF